MRTIIANQKRTHYVEASRNDKGFRRFYFSLKMDEYKQKEKR